jgi:hypothetical protein
MPEQGLGLQISISADKQLKHFLKDLPNHIGNSFEPEDIHATILYPEETARAGLSSRERQRLHLAETAISEAVESLDFVGERLTVAPNVLRPYKKFFGIEIIDDKGVCDQLREIGSQAIEAAVGIRLRSYLPTYHMSVARRNKGDGRLKPIVYNRHFPSQLTIAGFNTSVRTIFPPGKPNECYVNDPGRCDPNRQYS